MIFPGERKCRLSLNLERSGGVSLGSYRGLDPENASNQCRDKLVEKLAVFAFLGSGLIQRKGRHFPPPLERVEQGPDSSESVLLWLGRR